MERKLMFSWKLIMSMVNKSNTGFNKPGRYAANEKNTCCPERLTINSSANPGYLQQNMDLLSKRGKLNWSSSYVKGI